MSAPERYAVHVTHRVGRTVYVEAASASEAKRAARDVANWIDADPIDEDRTSVDGVRPERAEVIA